MLAKYAYYLCEADMKYYLAEALYKAICTMPLDQERFRENKYILAYIRKAVYMEYLKLLEEKKKSRKYVAMDDNYLYENSDQKEGDHAELWLSLTLDMIRDVLTADEYQMIIMRHIERYSEYEIAKVLAISRQGVNKRLRKIHAKIAAAIPDLRWNSK